MATKAGSYRNMQAEKNIAEHVLTNISKRMSNQGMVHMIEMK